MKTPILELSNLNVNPGGEGATALPTAFNFQSSQGIQKLFAANSANEREFVKFNSRKFVKHLHCTVCSAVQAFAAEDLFLSLWFYPQRRNSER
jgi:hypothetical protein